MKLITPASMPSQHRLSAFRPQAAFAMILSGIVSAAGVGVGVGAASAATPEESVPSLVVKYDPGSLTTEQGAHVLYRRIVAAAEKVCPQSPGGILVSGPVRQCRAQSITRAVEQVNDSRLAAIHAAASRKG
jgi:UrcA family protein